MRSKRPRSIFFEVTDQVVRGASIAAGGQARQIEQIKECSAEVPGMVKDFVQTFSSGRSTGLVRSRCGVYPSSRFLRVIKLDEPIRIADSREVKSLAARQLRADTKGYSLSPLHPEDGSLIAPSRAVKQIFTCGAREQELHEVQDGLVQMGIYPERMEIASVATLGVLLHLLQKEESQTPLLVLEIGADASTVFILSNNRVDAARPISFGFNSMISVLKKELALKDDAAARKLFYSESFDLTEMGPRLIDRLLRELQSSVGYYEVQTGQSIGKLFCSLLPGRLSWLTKIFAESLGTTAFTPDIHGLLEEFSITPPAENSNLPVSYLGLIGLMIDIEKGTVR